MTLPTRVRAHELHPEGVYRFLLGGYPLVWCASAGKHRPSLPYAAGVDHWYRDVKRPPVVQVAQAAKVLRVEVLPQANFEADALGLEQTMGPYLFLSPAQVPKAAFSPFAGSDAEASPAYVFNAESAIDNGGTVNSVAVSFLPDESPDPTSFRVAWTIPDKPGCEISFGPKILDVDFEQQVPGEDHHPSKWPEARTFIAP